MSTGQIILKSELANALALKYGMEVNSLLEVLSNTIIPNKKASREHVITLLVVAQQYDLNPFVREIQAFPNSSGGITPMVGIEGWTAIVNRHPAFDGCELTEEFDEHGALVCVECTMYRKDRSRPIKVREYIRECKRNTAPWTQWPIRMLRHKAYIQCARLAFSLSGIYDIDEIERMQDLGVVQRTDASLEGAKRVDLDALPEAGEASLADASLAPVSHPVAPVEHRRRGRPKKAESVTSPDTLVPQTWKNTAQESVTLTDPRPVNEDADDPTMTPEYEAGIIQPGQ